MRDARTACAFELSSSAALPLLMTKPSAPAIKATAPTLKEGRGSGGMDGTRTRDLRRDRAAL